MSVDHHGHLWVLQRPRTVPEVALGLAANPPATACCITAPAVLEFSADGKVMRSWGGPGFVADWPDTEHGIDVDGDGNVWITGNGRTDRLVIKFSPEGKHLLTIGKKSDAPLNNQDTSMLGRPSGLAVDDAAHEVFIADGYLNSRVMVFDSNTGGFKRGWGAYGAKLEEISNGSRARYTPGQAPSRQLNLVHCLAMSKDGLIYICDRTNDARGNIYTGEAGGGMRIQKFIPN